MSDRAALLARLVVAVADAPESQSLTWRLCDAARRVLGADGASISMDAQSTRVTLCATDEVAGVLESIHDVLGEGPATQAYLTGRQVTVTLPAPGDRWSVFAEAASRQTSAAVVFAVPMHAGSAVLGVLSLYRSAPGDLDEPVEEVGFLADALAAALVHDHAPTSEPGDGAAWSGPGDGASWSDRAEIHQATGMVVAQVGVGVRDALAILRAHAFALDRPLGDVAHAVVVREIDFSREGT